MNMGSPSIYLDLLYCVLTMFCSLQSFGPLLLHLFLTMILFVSILFFDVTANEILFLISILDHYPIFISVLCSMGINKYIRNSKIIIGYFIFPPQDSEQYRSRDLCLFLIYHGPFHSSLHSLFPLQLAGQWWATRWRGPYAQERGWLWAKSW